MLHQRAAVLCWAYLIGLFVAAFLANSPAIGTTAGLASYLFYSSWLGLGILAAVVMPRLWLLGPRASVWLVAGVIALSAGLYFQWRSPQPSPADISRFVSILEAQRGRPTVQVTGQVQNQPTLTRSERVRFILRVSELAITQTQAQNQTNAQAVMGKLYVTVPLLQGTGIYPGQRLTMRGNLYQPQGATNPGAFDFQTYLQRQGIYAGFSGSQVTADRTREPPWGWWKLRRRILRAQVKWLGGPAGTLVSAMVMGRRVVDLPYEVQDAFIQAGLAHVFSASGFHVSLLLGAILAATQRFSGRSQLVWGTGSLFLYMGLTGMQPSVTRAAFMGVGALAALAFERKVRRLGMLLLVATILLVINPLWIVDLGFQLSFLSTLGILITLPALQERLDWLPAAIAGWVAIPIAASLWTVPLVMFRFQQVTPYNIPANIVTAPLVLLVGLGGIFSGAVALIWPLAGSAVAWLLLYPTKGLMAIAQGFTVLPGSTWAVGQLPVMVLGMVYGLLILVWQSRWWQKRWYWVGLFVIALLTVQSGYGYYGKQQVTVLATNSEPVIVVQHQGKVTLINSGDVSAVEFTLLPFLKHQGINRLDCAIAFADQEHPGEWQAIASQVAITQRLRPVTESQPSQASSSWLPNQPISCGATEFEWLNSQPSLLQFRLGEQTWWVVSGEGDHTSELPEQGAANVILVGSSEEMNVALVEALRPGVAIAVGRGVDLEVEGAIGQAGQLLITGQDGAVQWMQHKGFQTHVAPESLQEYRP